MSNSRKRKEIPTPVPRRLPKVIKGGIEQVFPFEVPQPERISLELKQYIHELEKQYVERHNALVNNRTIYEQVVQRYLLFLCSLSTELDLKGVRVQQLGDLLRMTAVSFKEQEK